VIRNRGRVVGTRDAILTRYERICFDKQLISVLGKPLAALVCPGHPLLDATIDLILERHRDVLKQGSILVDENDPSEQVRALVYLKHSIQDARTDAAGNRRIVSRRMQYVEIMPSSPSNFSQAGKGIGGDSLIVKNAGYAPYLNYQALKEDDQALVEPILEQS
jgi:hypothetical protein